MGTRHGLSVTAISNRLTISHRAQRWGWARTRQEDQKRRHVHLPCLYARFTNSPQLGIDMAVPIW